MTNFISSQIIFYLTLVLVLFVPGVFLILATRLFKEFSLLELFLLAFGSSFAVVDFLVILLGRSPFHITRASVLGAIIVFCASCYAVYLNWRKKNKVVASAASQVPPHEMPRRATILVVLLMFLTIFIKTIYFTDSIFPTATDLGHHMYWTKVITTTGQLPDYAKTDIGADYTIGKPAQIPDFIIGEHLFFAAIALISGAEFISAFPIIVLFLVNIMSVLAIFVLVRAFFKNSVHRVTIAIIAVLLIGPLYAIASPQAKFASGGVIGNDVGNLLIPLNILLYMKAFSEKKSNLLAYALFISLGLAYTHHLSTFVFIFLSLFTLAAYGALNLKTISADIAGWFKLALTKEVLLVLAMGAVFVFVLYMPTYLNASAINTAVGAPSKASRAGLTLTQLKSTAGEARFAFAIVGIVVLLFASNLGKYNQAFLIGWIGALTLMSLRPDWLFVDIPSNRIASYIVYPVAIIAAYMFAIILNALKAEKAGKNYLSPVLLSATFFILMTFIATNGLYDNAQALNSSKDNSSALQTFDASQFLALHSGPADMILKDHNYLAADSWIKLFFMKGYNFPLSRGYFKRYQDDTKTREQCTNYMISTPSGDEAQKCYAGTGTDFIMINPKMDSAQFNRLSGFWQVYSSDDVGIFYKAS